MESVADAVPESAPVDIAPSGDVGGTDVSVDDSSLSENAILDKYAPRDSEEAPAESERETAKTTPAKPTAEGQTAEPAETEEEGPEPLLPEAEPENLKKAFKSLQKWHPDVAKQVRAAWFENRAYKETFTVPEAREMREIYPSVQEAREAKAAMADILAVDDLLNNSPGTLLSYVQQKNPQAFINLALQTPDLLYRMDPGMYRQNVSEPAVRNYHEFFAAQAKQDGNQDVLTAIEILKDYEQQKLGGPRAQARPQYQADPRMLAEYNQMKQQQVQMSAQLTNGFRDSVDNDFDVAMSDEVGKIIERSGADLSDAARQEIAERVLADVKDQLLADDVLQRRLGWALNQGPKSQQARQQLTNLVLANAKRFIPGSASKHLGWMTKEILRVNQAEVEKASKVTPTRRVSGGSPGSSPAQRLTQEQISKLSDDELFAAAADGRLG